MAKLIQEEWKELINNTQVSKKTPSIIPYVKSQESLLKELESIVEKDGYTPNVTLQKLNAIKRQINKILHLTTKQ